MLNHARSLLLNVPSSPTGFTAGPGEEFIPPEFRPLPLAGALREVHAILFGADPDRLARNYLVRQYLALLHATELGEHVLSLDPRITYDPTQTDEFYTEQFVPRVRKLGDTSTELYLVGRVAPPDRAGRSQHACRVEVLTASTVRVQRLTPPLAASIQSYTLESGLSSLIELTGTGLLARFQPGTVPQSFNKLSLLNYGTPWFTVLPAFNDPLSDEDKKHLLHLIAMETSGGMSSMSLGTEADSAKLSLLNYSMPWVTTLPDADDDLLDGDKKHLLNLYSGGLESEVSVAGRWQVEVAARPQRDLAQVLDELTQSEHLLDVLFGEASPDGRHEPFRTFRNLWRQHPEMPYRLGAVLLAWIYRADALRKDRS